MIRPESCSVIGFIYKSYSSFSAAGTIGCLELSSRCCVVGMDRSRSCRRWSGIIARQARYSVLQQISPIMTHKINDMFRGRESLHNKWGRSGNGPVKTRKSSCRRWNQTRDIKNIKQWRNSLANLSVSGCMKVWQNTKRMADRRDHLNIQETQSQVFAQTTEEFHCLACQKKCMPNALKVNAVKCDCCFFDCFDWESNYCAVHWCLLVGWCDTDSASSNILLLITIHQSGC